MGGAEVVRARELELLVIHAEVLDENVGSSQSAARCSRSAPSLGTSSSQTAIAMFSVVGIAPAEERIGVEIGVVEAAITVVAHEPLELAEVDDHAGPGIDGARARSPRGRSCGRGAR